VGLTGDEDGEPEAGTRPGAAEADAGIPGPDGDEDWEVGIARFSEEGRESAADGLTEGEDCAATVAALAGVEGSVTCAPPEVALPDAEVLGDDSVPAPREAASPLALPADGGGAATADPPDPVAAVATEEPEAGEKDTGSE
jgi:hypothetical protein